MKMTFSQELRKKCDVGSELHLRTLEQVPYACFDSVPYEFTVSLILRLSPVAWHSRNAAAIAEMSKLA